jgi:hypothetical protein
MCTTLTITFGVDGGLSPLLRNQRVGGERSDRADTMMSRFMGGCLVIEHLL